MKGIEMKEQFILMRAKGMSFDAIAKELKVSKKTLIEWSKEFYIEIANMKAIELELLYEQFYLSKRKRIELLGEKLNSIKNEIENRGLEEISTEKLFDLLIKYHNALKEENGNTVFKVKKSIDDMTCDSDNNYIENINV